MVLTPTIVLNVTVMYLALGFDSFGCWCREDRHRESEDRRKGEDRSTRSESIRKLLVNGRETGDDARLQIRSRRDGSEERETDVPRNGTSLAKERGRDHAYDERRSQRDSGRLSSHYDDENRRDHKDSYHTSLQHDKVRDRLSPFQVYQFFIVDWINSFISFRCAC